MICQQVIQCYFLNAKVMVCYYGSWAVYRPGAGKFDVEDIDPFVCTHIIYGFAGLGPDNTIVSLDSWNDLYDNYGKGWNYIAVKNNQQAKPKNMQKYEWAASCKCGDFVSNALNCWKTLMRLIFKL